MTEGKLVANDKDIVVPGEVLATGMNYLPSKGTYRSGDHIYAGRIGVLNVDGKVLKLTPLAGRYLPQVGDVIVAKVSDVLMSGWRVDTNSPYSAVLSVKEATSEYIASKSDLNQYFDIGEWVMCKIIQVTSQNLIDITMRGPGLRKLENGRIINVNPAKIARLIGKNASMVSLLQETTGVELCIGQNGWVWMSGEPENELVCLEAIELIEREAHISGLTERVKKFLDSQKERIVPFERTPPAPRTNGPGPRGGGRREGGFGGGRREGGYGGGRREGGHGGGRREGGYGGGRGGPRRGGSDGQRRSFR